MRKQTVLSDLGIAQPVRAENDYYSIIGGKNNERFKFFNQQPFKPFIVIT
jgi:hypothetical protein